MAVDIAADLAEAAGFDDASQDALCDVVARALARLSVLAASAPSRALLADEALPGFSVSVFRKTAPPASAHTQVAGESPEALASRLVAAAFAARTGRRAVLLDAPDAAVLLFPVPHQVAAVRAALRAVVDEG